ncbi:MAG: transketolase, partial [Rickettsiales bacterium]|nr:transketolase [Rickettsiales bacterium]
MAKERQMQAKQAEKLRNMADAVRFLSIDMVTKAKSGHPGMPMGAAELATVLFARHLRFSAKNPRWANRDRFILSAGHGSALLYSLLYLSGYGDISLADLKCFRSLGAKAAGHPEYGMLAGIETTTGPLGQGVATAVGMALANKIRHARGEKIDGKIYVLAGDGDLIEGVSEEAVSLAGSLRLDNLVVLWDDNGITIDGRTAAATATDMKARFRANGWNVFEVTDGHDVAEIDAVIARAKKSAKPAFVAVKTTIGKGLPEVENTSGVHGSPLSEAQSAKAREKCCWPHAPFEVPADVLSNWRAVGGARDREAARSAIFLPDRGIVAAKKSIEKLKRRFIREGFAKATRDASGAVLAAIVPEMPELIGGSADLSEPTRAETAASRPVTRRDFSGNYVRYGIREHGMAAAMNGLALSGFRPYGATFLTFSDYMRPALRLSALMRLPVAYVFTHDSVFLGEDGPTHQPVEHIAALRAMPNLNVIRPADAVETAEAWEIALSAADTPTAILLSRQTTPLLRENAAGNLTAKGAYVIAEAAKGARHMTLIATGTEVALALEARKMLLAVHGINARVVSMPSWFLFEQQSARYKAATIDPGT